MSSTLWELLEKDIVHSLVWLDTRDMGADGLTKGAVSREALQELMRGAMVVRHPSERWQCKKPGGAKVENDDCGSGPAEAVHLQTIAVENGGCGSGFAEAAHQQARSSRQILSLFCLSNIPLDRSNASTTGLVLNPPW